MAASNKSMLIRLGVIGAFVLIGLAALTVSSAATYTVQQEAESGVVDGVDVVGGDGNASAGQYVRFGAGGALPGGCGGPITITVGGTYSGCYQSTSTGRAAVTIATAAPVIINHATIRHAGKGIASSVMGVHLTLAASKFQALDAGMAANQRAVELEEVGMLAIEHNRLVDGQGIWLGRSTPETIVIRYNDVINIGRYPHPTSPNCCVQFVQFDNVTAAAEIAWNRVTNYYGVSDVEDNINMYMSSGRSDDGRITIHHNLIDGAYPRSGSGSSYTGGGILVGDSGGQYMTIGPGNRVINTANYGLSISGGAHNRIIGNRVVSDITANTPTGPGQQVMSDSAQAILAWTYNASYPTTDAILTGNTAGLERRPCDGDICTRNDWWVPAAANDVDAANVHITPNDLTPAVEQAERTGWNADLAAAGLTVGPGW